MKYEGQLIGQEIHSRSPRVETEFLVLLRCGAGKFPARVTNISATGFRLRSARALQVGWEVTLEVPKLSPIKCVIRWVAGKEAGGVFLESVAL